jgi:hypothetical protein
VTRGSKVTDPQFAAHHGFPKYGSIGMHVLGYPERLAKPPYVRQARRLFARYDELRERIPRQDERWWEALVDAAVGFETIGELPDDDLIRDVVLADAEMAALWAHKRGRNVRELMALLDCAARRKGEKREDAITAVLEFVRGARAAAG